MNIQLDLASVVTFRENVKLINDELSRGESSFRLVLLEDDQLRDFDEQDNIPVLPRLLP
jgi:hypothetical protein